MPRRTPRETYESLGLIKASVKIATEHDDIAMSIYLDGPQEWQLLADALYANPMDGYRGKKFVIPPGHRVILLRVDDPTAPVGG